MLGALRRRGGNGGTGSVGKLPHKKRPHKKRKMQWRWESTNRSWAAAVTLRSSPGNSYTPGCAPQLRQHALLRASAAPCLLPLPPGSAAPCRGERGRMISRQGEAAQVHAPPPAGVPPWTPPHAAHFATAGVRASVMGVRMGNSALLHRKASASVELPPVSAFSSHPWLPASAPAVSSYRSSAAQGAGRGRAAGGRWWARHAGGQVQHGGRCSTACPGRRAPLTGQQPNLLQRRLHVHMVVDGHVAACGWAQAGGERSNTREHKSCSARPERQGGAHGAPVRKEP